MTWLASGMLVSQGIQLLAAPLLGRLYTPDSFGKWAMLLSVAGIASAFGGLRYELAIVPAANDEEAAGVMGVQSLSNAAVAALTFVIVILFGNRIAAAIGDPYLTPLLYLTPVIVLLTGAGNVATYGLIRGKHFKELALYRTAQSASSVAVQTVSGLLSGGPGGLIIGGIIGQIALGSALIGLLRRSYGRLLRSALSIPSLRACAHKHRNFPRFMIAYGLAGVLRDRGLLLVLGIFGTPQEVGFYAFALRIIYAPMALISNSFNSVIYQRAAEATKRSDIGPLVFRVLSRLVTLTFPGFVVVAWFSTKLFAFVFGPQWEQAGLYASLMIPPAMTHLLVGPFDRMFDIVGRQKIAMGIEVGYSVVSLLGFSISLILFHNVLLSVAIFSLATVLYDIVWITAVYHAYKLPYADLLRIGMRVIVLCGAVIIALWIATFCAHKYSHI